MKRPWYVGVLTDGARWHLYNLEGDALQLVSSFEIADTTNPDVPGLLLWLEGVLATTSRIHPTPREIERRLGATSSGHGLDAADLASLYEVHRNEPTVKLKRELWGRLLTTALGTAFEDSDELFVNHTLLVLTAEVIAHAVIGYDLTDPQLSPETICSGALFAQAQIGNVVEADFFDWPVEVDGGDRFVRTLARRLSRFAWDEVEHDVMKVLYESVISTEQRHRLGEYYTPDWLADRIVEEVITDPLATKALDPSCGSGTFLFHAIAKYLTAADNAGLTNREALAGVCDHVAGIDVHPVAVAFARVTYLLAIGMDRLADRPPMSVPVYLGDSVQWTQEENLLSADALSIDTSSSPATLFAEPLRFPRRLLDDPGNFDRLVTAMADKAASRTPGSKPPPLTAVFNRHRVEEDDRPILIETFRSMCDLHDSGRDHIWGYFTRNLARPVWFSRTENRVDALIGNPPWLSYRFMTASMQATFRRMTTERGMWAGSAVATNQDLSALFVARSSELYLRHGGKFGFVMPLAALSRKQFAGFRTGDYRAPSAHTILSFGSPWDLHAVKPSFFPVPASVAFGTRSTNPVPLTDASVPWSGRVTKHNASWQEAEPGLTVGEEQIGAASAQAPTSPYAPAFTQGASVVPRMLFTVVPAPSTPLGAGPGRRSVRSRRSANEKAPWKSLAPLTGSVEDEFVFPMHLGETILPFRLQEPLEAVIPWDGQKLLEPTDDDLDAHPGLARWWREANAVWLANRSSDRLTLLGQLDYMHKFTQQFPAPKHRVAYTKGGMYLAAVQIDDPLVVIDHMLYWAEVATPEEGQYLTAVLNSDAITLAVRQFQARGEHNPRHFDKYIFRLPIPLYDESEGLHSDLVQAAAHATAVADEVSLPDMSFQAQRRMVRAALADDGVAMTLDGLVDRLLHPGM
ncbi:MAG: N-6 DNA methylase [Solirubrobacterales bacterium]